MLCDDLKTMRDAHGLTNNQLSEATNIPASSVSRIMSGETSNPSFQYVAALVAAMGESLDELAGIKAKSVHDSDSTRNFFEKMLAEKDKIIATKDKWLSRFFVMLCCVVMFVLVVLAIDLLNGNIGYFRY